MKLRIAKIVLLVFLAAFLFALWRTGNYRDVPAGDIEQALLQETSVSSLTAGTDNDLRRFYGLTPSDYDGYVFFRSESAMAVDELLIVKLKDASQLDAVEAQIQARLDSQLEAFDGYGVEQTALLQAHVQKSMGNYVFLGISPDAQEWLEVFSSCIR